VTPVGGTLGLDHIKRHAQPDLPVGRPAAPGDFAVAVLGGDLVAEVSRCPGAGMRDQRLFLIEFQLEFITQERRQLIFDGLGFGFWPGESQKVVVGLCRAPGYAEREMNLLVGMLVPVAGAA
jgi:hypothetical protein